MKVARGIPLTIGVERHESSKSANAISSKMVRGVAGLSNMVRGDPGGQLVFNSRPKKKSDRNKISDYFQRPNGTRDARVEGLAPHWQWTSEPKIETKAFNAKNRRKKEANEGESQEVKNQRKFKESKELRNKGMTRVQISH